MADIPVTVARPRRRHRAVAPFVALGLAIVLGLLVAVLANGKPAVDRFAKSPLVGKAAPAVAGPTYDGSSFLGLGTATLVDALAESEPGRS